MLADMVRRQYEWRMLLGVLMSGAPWYLAAATGDLRFAVAVSCCMTLFLGPIATTLSVPRLFRSLPVSRREIRRATWIVAAAVTPAMTTAAKLPAVLFGLYSVDAGLTTLALSSAGDVAVAILGCLLIRPPADRRVYRDRVSRTHPSLQRRLSGIPRLLLHELVVALSMTAGLVLVFGGIVYAIDRFTHSPRTFEQFLRAQKLLVFDGTPLALGDRATDLLGMVVWYALFAGSIAFRFPDFLRHLRVLPIGTWRILGMAIAWPASIWLVAWIGLLALSASVGNGVHALHPALWIGLVGLSALAQAVSLLLAARFRFVFYSAPVWFLPLFRLVGDLHPGVRVAFGIAAAVAAASLMRYALTQTATYSIPSTTQPV